MLLSKPKKIVLAMLVLVTWSTLVQSVSAYDYRDEEEINQIAMDRYNIEEVAEEYLGEFTITHYCGCRECNGRWTGYPAKNGEELQDNYTIAVDPNVIPLGTYIKIDGHDVTYKACDTGSKIKNNRIDIYVSDHNECLELGIKRKVKVWIIKE